MYQLPPVHVGELSMVILRADQHVQIYEGCPHDYGVEDANVYVTFVYSRLLITVWAVSELEPYERRTISRQILDHIRDRALLM
jgi:hypothetical protein